MTSSFFCKRFQAATLFIYLVAATGPSEGQVEYVIKVYAKASARLPSSQKLVRYVSVGAVKRRMQGFAIQRAQSLERATFALSVAIPVLAYICR